MEPQRYRRRTFVVNAIQVDLDNIEAVAEWCGGTFVPGKHQHVEIFTPEESATKAIKGSAYPGDWVVQFGKQGRHFRVYTDMSFKRTFSLEGDEKLNLIEQIVRAAMGKQDVATYYGESSRGMDIVAKRAAKKIMELM